MWMKNTSELIPNKWFITLILKSSKLNNLLMINKNISVGLYLKIKNKGLSFAKDRILLTENQQDLGLQENKLDSLPNFKIKLKNKTNTNKVKNKWHKV
jgi:hypothetical protein